MLDTCHAWAAGWDLATAVDDLRAITGRIDLVHLNNSRDPHGSSRDRHAPLSEGEIPTELLVEVARSADCPVILETPGDRPRMRRRSSCSEPLWLTSQQLITGEWLVDTQTRATS